MALISTRRASLLDYPVVLAPERYDPRREVSTREGAARLSDVAMNIRKTVESIEGRGPCLVLDTSDAREGIATCRRNRVTEIGSSKKIFQVGDVIISRLRPYLRQVAYIDASVSTPSTAALLCSTEFFVLRSVDKQSIAFLVPFLLSAQVQRVLAASQEGGHHPRVRESALLTLPLPSSLLDSRAAASCSVERSVALYRQSEHELALLIGAAEEALPRWDDGVCEGASDA